MAAAETLPFLAAATLYLLGLSVVAELAERRVLPESWVSSKWTYSFALGVYATNWTFFGSVGMAATDGYKYLTIYMGVSLACLLVPTVWLPLFRLVRARRLSSLADVFAFRYRSQMAAALVALSMLVAGLPYIALQLRAVSEMARVFAGVEDRNAVAFGFTSLMIAFALVFGARHLPGVSAEGTQHRGLVAAMSIETVVKILALFAVAHTAVQQAFGGWLGMEVWLSEHPEQVSELMKPVRDQDFPTLVLLSFAAGFLLPRQFHLAFVECPTEAALSGARWRFPLILMLFCLLVPPIFWAGGKYFPEIDPDTYVLYLAQTHRGTAVMVLLGGLAAASGMMVVSSIALASMAVNHLVLPVWRPQGELIQVIAWIRRVGVAAVLAGGYIFYSFVGENLTLASIGLISFVAIVQLLPGLAGLFYMPRLSRFGLTLGLAGGLSVWFVLLVVPWLGGAGLSDAFFAWAIKIDPSWHSPWTLVTGFSLLTNLLLCLLGSWWVLPSEEEQDAADLCEEGTSAEVSVSKPRQIEILTASLTAVLGTQTARRLVSAAGGDEVRSLDDLRRTEARLRAMLTGLLGPLLGPAVLEDHRRGSSSLAKQLRLLDVGGASVPRGGVARVELVRRYLRAVLAELPVGVCALGPEEEILVWNRALEGLTGLRGDAWIGHGLKELPPPLAELFARAASQTEGPTEAKVQMQGKEQVLRTSVTELEGGGQVLMLEDLTEQRALQAQVAHEDRLRSLGRLSAAVGHEVGNPLTGVLMLARNLAAEEEPEDLAERLHLIIAEAEKIDSIIRSMSAYARVGSDDALVAPGPKKQSAVVVQEVVEDALRLVRLAKKGRRIFWGYDCPPSVRVLGDQQQLTQIFVNLLTNACDASTDGSSVKVVALSQDASWVQVDVTDRGGGMTPEVASRIFEPFFTTKSSSAGTGLGLAVSEGLVRAHGGRVEVHSRPGEGTTMRIILRRAGPPAAAEADAQEELFL